MARKKIGAVYKSKDPKSSPYVKIDLYKEETVTLRHGQYLNVESKAFQLNSLEEAVASGRMSEADAVGARERVNKIPDFILGELVLSSK